MNACLFKSWFLDNHCVALLREKKIELQIRKENKSKSQKWLVQNLLIKEPQETVSSTASELNWGWIPLSSVAEHPRALYPMSINEVAVWPKVFCSIALTSEGWHSEGCSPPPFFLCTTLFHGFPVRRIHSFAQICSCGVNWSLLQ